MSRVTICVAVVALLLGCKGLNSDPSLGVSGEVTEGDGFEWDGNSEWQIPLISCKTDSDCTSGLCLHLLADSICAFSCYGKKCPRDGWNCFGIKDGFEHDTELCLPSHALLCLPCADDDECTPRGKEFTGLCRDVAESGQFCGIECVAHEDCPNGYNCMAFKLENGDLSGQCQPVIGQCVCNEIGKASEWSSDCGYINEWGECKGESICPISGSAVCTATPPADDICNGLDDNCDGEIDEGGNVGEECGKSKKGICKKGIFACVDGEEVCDGAVWPEDEVCDGLDNDCDMLIDESYPDQYAMCGFNTGICLPGQTLCVKGELVCHDEVPPEDEVCDGKDNDCDGKTDEELQGCE